MTSGRATNSSRLTLPKSKAATLLERATLFGKRVGQSSVAVHCIWQKYGSQTHQVHTFKRDGQDCSRV
jgi:hypothetical protein